MDLFLGMNWQRNIFNSLQRWCNSIPLFSHLLPLYFRSCIPRALLVTSLRDGSSAASPSLHKLNTTKLVYQVNWPKNLSFSSISLFLRLDKIQDNFSYESCGPWEPTESRPAGKGLFKTWIFSRVFFLFSPVHRFDSLRYTGLFCWSQISFILFLVS